MPQSIQTTASLICSKLEIAKFILSLAQLFAKLVDYQGGGWCWYPKNKATQAQLSIKGQHNN